MSAKSFLQNLVRMRKHTVQAGLCRKNPMLVHRYAQHIEQWMRTWNANDSQCAAYIRRHVREIEYLLPGGDNKVATVWRNRLEGLLHATG